MSEMRRLIEVASDFVLHEHGILDSADAYFGAWGPPVWTHTEQDQDRMRSRDFVDSILSEPVPLCGDGDLRRLVDDTLRPLSKMGSCDNAPGYLAYVPSGGLFHAALAEWIAASLNRYVTTFQAAPGLAALEMLSVQWLSDAIGLAAVAKASGCRPSGLLVSGGSSATLHAVHAARCAKGGIHPSKLVAYYGENAHSAILKALSVCGIHHSRMVPVDHGLCIRIDALQEAITRDLQAGLTPFLLIGTAGDVLAGSVDDLPALRSLSDAYGMWFHIDAAYGGFFAITERGKRVLLGLETADSVAVDPHKGLGLPYGTGALLVRDEITLRRAFSYHASYLRPGSGDPDDVGDLMDLGFECSRDFRGLRIWLPLKLLGLSPFRDNLDSMLCLTDLLVKSLSEIPEIEIVVPPALSICTFRLRSPASAQENRDLLDRINRSGRHFLTGCTLPGVLGGGFALRVALLSFRTQRSTIESLVETIKSALHSINLSVS